MALTESAARAHVDMWSEQKQRADAAEAYRDAVLEKAIEALECFEAAMTEGWIDALANGEIELVRDLWDRRLRYAHTLLLDMCS